MSKANANIIFLGGCRADEEYEVIPAAVREELLEPTGLWYRSVGTRVEIVKGGALDDNWLSFEFHLYEKGGKNGTGHFEYHHTLTGMKERCSAQTKKGKRCMKSAFKDLPVCETHKEKI